MSLRRRVLACFKDLHRARKNIFAGDDYALTASRIRINEEFKKNKDVFDANHIEKLIQDGHDAAEYLRKFVVQAKYNPEKDAYEMRLTEEHHLEDNYPYLGGDSAEKQQKSK